MAQWQSYVDDVLVGSGKVTHAAILGWNGVVWAKTTSFEIQPEEGAALSTLFRSQEGPQTATVSVGGVRYMFLRGDDRTVQCRKGSSGVVIARTKQALVVGAYNETIMPNIATLAVEKLADYLMDNGV